MAPTRWGAPRGTLPSVLVLRAHSTAACARIGLSAPSGWTVEAEMDFCRGNRPAAVAFTARVLRAHSSDSTAACARIVFFGLSAPSGWTVEAEMDFCRGNRPAVVAFTARVLRAHSTAACARIVFFGLSAPSGWTVEAKMDFCLTRCLSRLFVFCNICYPEILVSF